jgi:hypothetical protein
MGELSKIPYPKNDDPVKDNHSPGKNSDQKDAKKMETVKAADKLMKISEAPKKPEMKTAGGAEKMTKRGKSAETMSAGKDAKSMVAANYVETYYLVYYNQKEDTIETRIVKDTGDTGQSHYQLHFTSYSGDTVTTDIDYATYRGFEIMAQRKKEEAQKPEHDKNYKAYEKLMVQGKQIEAIQFLIDTYKLNNGMTNYKLEIVADNRNGSFEMFTRGDLKEGNIVPIQVEDSYIQYSLFSYDGFASFVRALGHELLHLKDITGDDIINDHEEREFRAYYFSATAPNLPNVGRDSLFEYITNAEKKYKKMSVEKQKEYKFKYETLLGIKQAYDELNGSQKLINEEKTQKQH